MSEQQQTLENKQQETNSTFLREQLLCKLGAELKSTREQRKLEISEVAQSLKLRQVYLHALESGNWQEMPDEVYAVGFLKQYASFLGVDVADDVAKLKSAEYQLTKPLTFPDPAIAPRKSWVIVAALTFVILVIIFNMFGDDNSDDGGLILPPPVEESVGISIEQPPVTTDTPVKISPAKKSVSESVSVEHTYDFTAIGSDCWIQLSLPASSSDSDPELFKEFLLKAGETVSVSHASPYLLVTSGNAGALQVVADGQMVIEVGTLGRENQVVRNRKVQPLSATNGE